MPLYVEIENTGQNGHLDAGQIQVKDAMKFGSMRPNELKLN